MDEQCVPLMRVMRDPAVGKGEDEKTSWKASFMKPANPTGEFLRWWAEPTNQLAHSEPWQQPPRQSKTVVWCVRVCVRVFVWMGWGGGRCLNICVSEKSVSVRLITFPIKSISSLFRSFVEAGVSRRLLICRVHRRLSCFHPMSGRLIEDLMNSLLRSPINSRGARTYAQAQVCVCINRIERKIRPSWIRQKLIVEQLMYR